MKAGTRREEAAGRRRRDQTGGRGTRKAEDACPTGSWKSHRGTPAPVAFGEPSLPTPWSQTCRSRAVESKFLLFWAIGMGHSVTVAPGPWHVTSVS